MKLKKPFKGVPEGAIYPIEFEVGTDCPPELEAGARSLGALDEGDPVDFSAMTVPDIKALLDAKGIAYDAAAKKADLIALVPAA